MSYTSFARDVDDIALEQIIYVTLILGKHEGIMVAAHLGAAFCNAVIIDARNVVY